jgi:hypothetical protein
MCVGDLSRCSSNCQQADDWLRNVQLRAAAGRAAQGPMYVHDCQPATSQRPPQASCEAPVVPAEFQVLAAAAFCLRDVVSPDISSRKARSKHQTERFLFLAGCKVSVCCSNGYAFASRPELVVVQM